MGFGVHRVGGAGSVEISDKGLGSRAVWFRVSGLTYGSGHNPQSQAHKPILWS